MTAADLLPVLEAQGVFLWADDTDLRLMHPPGALTADLTATLKAHKADLLALLNTRTRLPAPSTWPEAWRDFYEERAGIREYDGGFTRPEAERLAVADILAHFTGNGAGTAQGRNSP